MNTQRWVTGSLVVLALVAFLALRQIFGLIWDVFQLPLYDDLVVALPDILALLGAAAIFFVLLKNDSVNTFLKEVVLELSKVTWPAQRETLISAVVVIVMVGLASLLFFSFDVLWGSLTQRLIIN